MKVKVIYKREKIKLEDKEKVKVKMRSEIDKKR